MGSITIRNVDDAIKQGARLAGVNNGRSMEAEILALLDRTYRPAQDQRTARILAMTPAEVITHLVETAKETGATLPVDAIEAEEIEFPAL